MAGQRAVLNFGGLVNAIYVAPNATIAWTNMEVTGPPRVQIQDWSMAGGTGEENVTSKALHDLPYHAGSPIYPAVISDVGSSVSAWP